MSIVLIIFCKIVFLLCPRQRHKFLCWFILGLTHNFAGSSYFSGPASVMDYPAPIVMLDSDGKWILKSWYDTQWLFCWKKYLWFWNWYLYLFQTGIYLKLTTVCGMWYWVSHFSAVWKISLVFLPLFKPMLIDGYHFHQRFQYWDMIKKYIIIFLLWFYSILMCFAPLYMFLSLWSDLIWSDPFLFTSVYSILIPVCLFLSYSRLFVPFLFPSVYSILSRLRESCFKQR